MAHKMLLIVSAEGGFRRKVDKWHPDGKEYADSNVRISLNGPAAFTFEESDQMQQAIHEAKLVLQAE